MTVMTAAAFFTVWSDSEADFSPSFFQLLFFFLKQHHLFWNTEWQYLLWREANTPQSHGLTASNPFCGDVLLLSVEDPAGCICSALFRDPDEHLCRPLLFHHSLSRTTFKKDQ